MSAEPREALIAARDVVVEFTGARSLLRRRREVLRAVDEVSLDVERGETLALVGESGSGKSTLGRAILQLRRPTSGSVTYQGRELTTISARERRELASDLQLIFQDPYASLDPRMTVAQIVEEPLRLRGLRGPELERTAREALDVVGLAASHLDRRPHQFSGGQRQRIAVARALVLRPTFVVCDEPVSALDVSVQAQVLNLLSSLQEELGLTYLFISHDLAVVRHIADRVAVMYLGRIVESAPVSMLETVPFHPYTTALLSAVPTAEPEERTRNAPIVLRGDPPSPTDRPKGCALSSRCWLRSALGDPARCAEERPALAAVGDGWSAACHFAAEPKARALAAEALGVEPQAPSVPAETGGGTSLDKSVAE